MKFRAHDTFFIRKGWLNKGLRNVNADAGVFMGSKGNPMDVLGIGANMVKALRSSPSSRHLSRFCLLPE